MRALWNQARGGRRRVNGDSGYHELRGRLGAVWIAVVWGLGYCGMGMDGWLVGYIQGSLLRPICSCTTAGIVGIRIPAASRSRHRHRDKRIRVEAVHHVEFEKAWPKDSTEG